MNEPPKGTPEWERWRHCGRKHRYDSDPALTGSLWLNTYRCRYCGEWHITQKPKTAKEMQEIRDRNAARRLALDETPPA